MADEYRLDEFFKAKMTAAARSGSDPRSSRGFGRTYVYENVRRAAEYERASARWDAFKSNQEAEGYENGVAGLPTCKGSGRPSGTSRASSRHQGR